MSYAAFFKTLRLGDALKGPPTRRLDFKGADLVQGAASNLAIPIERYGGASYAIRCRAYLIRPKTETVPAFELRKQTFLENLAEVGIPLSTEIYTVQGYLVLVQDPATDHISTLSADASAGTGVAISTATPLSGLSADSYVYIAQGSTYEVQSVASFTSESSFTLDLSGSYTTGATVARVLLAWPGCYLRGPVEIEGQEPGTHSAEKDIDIELVTTESAIHE